MSINGTVYVRFNTAPKEDILRTLNFVSEEFVDVYFSTQVRWECGYHYIGFTAVVVFEEPEP